MAAKHRSQQNGLILPASVASLVESAGSRHPGLLLDKFTTPGQQSRQRSALDAVCSERGDPDLLKALLRRRDETLRSLAAIRLRAATTAPLTLHLARAAALENAGIHLHPLYGFCCLPASGIKGMARAWAETVWLADQEDDAQGWSRIGQVFGWSPGSERGKRWRPTNTDKPDGSRAGDVVFHDAWPTEWPQLATDITNNHHPKYYQGNDDPGDWEDPVPVYFLTAPACIEFDFAASLRKPGAADGRELVELARDWIAGALCHAGAGAKTNAGYGRFRLVNLPPPPRPRRARRSWSGRLTLATPAFLAGARQDQTDCKLRPATLRGLLRWWWRTMHASHLGRNDLHSLETAVWGSAKTGGALALTVGDGKYATPCHFDSKQVVRTHGIPTPPKRSKTIQGLFYASYGMDERNKRRWYLDSGASWTVTLTSRSSTMQTRKGRSTLSADQILRQGQTALWLLCRFGGVGSKARKGFGSFRDLTVDGTDSVDTCKEEAQALRKALDLEAGSCGDSPKLEDLMLREQRTKWSNAWFAVDQVGAIYQAMVKSFAGAEKEDRVALGLPRRVGKRSRQLQAGRLKRHSSPIHWSLSREDDGSFLVRCAAFPAPRLPNIDTSRRVLRQAVERAKDELKKQASGGSQKPGGTHSGQGRQKAKPAKVPAAFHAPPPKAPDLPRSGDRVECILLPEKTRKGGWKAKHEASGATGAIQNSAHVPADSEPGQIVTLIVQYARRGDAAFKWPGPDDGPRSANARKPMRPRRGHRR